MSEQPLTRLRAGWQQLLLQSGVAVKAGDALFAELCAAYSEPHRHYHNLQHIDQMLSLLQQAGVATPAAKWATWFHDCIYRAGQTDNEQLSANKAVTAMTQLGIDATVIGEAEMMILATKQHRSAHGSTVLLAMLDADMAIVGSPPEQYQQYQQAVRAEYMAIPNFLYRQGRRAFLKAVLAEPQIFKTPWFATKYELQARTNLAAELTVL